MVDRSRVSLRGRILAGLVFGVVLSMFIVLHMAATGRIDMTDWFGICGFKQKYGLPCAGCYWTTSAMLYARGRILSAFVAQPAAAFFCTVLLITAFFALLIAIWGVNFRFLHPPLRTWLIQYGIAIAVIVILAGWAVTLARAWVQGYP
ncbi:MAG: DUF2752 domain-containing protein [Sedimentisphaerales bacterium]|nr:DUF2752 domain-containing protein [Sedimentisphaerales bacterium]